MKARTLKLLLVTTAFAFTLAASWLPNVFGIGV